MKISDLLQIEQIKRKEKQWFPYSGPVLNDNGVTVKVQIKSFGFYNQVFRIGDDPVNRCSGHAINKATLMKKFITDTINDVQA